MLNTTKEQIENAILLGITYEEFLKDHVDVKPTRWRDIKYTLRKSGKIIPIEKVVEELLPIINEEKTKEQLRLLRLENSKLKRYVSDLDFLFSDIKESIKELPKIKSSNPINKNIGKINSTVILPLYDLHIGHVCNLTIGKYDLGIFNQRCTILVEQLLHELKHLSNSRNLEKLIIILGGDIIDGRTIYKGHSSESCPLKYQLTYGPEIIADTLISKIVSYFPTVKVISLPGNHGRLGDRNELDKLDDNLDLIFSHILKLRCDKIKNIDWIDCEDWFSYFSLYDYKYFATHGDTFKSAGGVPINGAIKYKNTIQETINNMIDVLIVGHHHSLTDIRKGFSKICMTNSWVGTNQYSFSEGLGGSPASQVLFVADESNPIAISYEFMLDKKDTYKLEINKL